MRIVGNTTDGDVLMQVTKSEAATLFPNGQPFDLAGLVKRLEWYDRNRQKLVTLAAAMGSYAQNIQSAVDQIESSDIQQKRSVGNG